MPPRKGATKAKGASNATTPLTTGIPVFPKVSAKQLKRIGELMKECFGWEKEKEARPMQKDAGTAQTIGEDVLLQAPTGVGKTAVVAAPHVFPEHKGRVTIFVSPLIALQEEMVTTFRDEYKLEAVAVNSTRRHSLARIMQDICSGKYAIVLISPEMLQSRRFMDNVLRNKEFAARVLSLVVDEAHTVSHWGANFRKKYGTLGIVRAFLPPRTSVVAMSATLTPRVRRDVLKKLQFSASYLNIDLGNNRPTVSLVVRACHRTLSSFGDLDFVIPKDISSPDDIPSTFIYCDDKDEGDCIIDHLRSLLPLSLQEEGLIRPFNATLSHTYRKNALLHFKAGNIRVLVCTDAAGMGCNVPNIEVVVQWKLPDKLSTFVQRAGRAARRAGTTGLAVLLVEPNAYGIVPQSEMAALEARLAAESAGTQKKTTRKGRGPKGWAKEHGRSRGLKAGVDENPIDSAIKVQVDETDEDEGLAALYLTGDCRRRVVGDSFHNKDTAATVPCCDLCCPELLARTLPGPPAKGRKRGKKRKSKKDEEPAGDIVDALRRWRSSEWNASFRDIGFVEDVLLPDPLIRQLALYPDEFTSLKEVQDVAGPWSLWTTYGKDVYRAICGVYNDRATRESSRVPAAAEPRRRDMKRARAGSESSQNDATPSPTTHALSTAQDDAQSETSAATRVPAAPAPKRRRITTTAAAPPPGVALVAIVAPLLPGEVLPRALRGVALQEEAVAGAASGAPVIAGSDGHRYFSIDGVWYMFSSTTQGDS